MQLSNCFCTSPRHRSTIPRPPFGPRNGWTRWGGRRLVLFLSLRVLTPHRRKVPTCDVRAQKIARLHHFPSIHNSHELSIPPAPANTRYCAFLGFLLLLPPTLKRRCSIPCPVLLLILLLSSITSSRRAPKPSPATAGHRQEALSETQTAKQRQVPSPPSIIPRTLVGRRGPPVSPPTPKAPRAVQQSSSRGRDCPEAPTL